MIWSWFKKLLGWEQELPWHLKVGQTGEQYAKRYLQKKGLKFLVSHYVCAEGELDLVFREGDSLVFVEVKTRTLDGDGPLDVRPAGAVNREKREHLYGCIRHYLKSLRRVRPLWRCDVVEVIVGSKLEIKEIRHIPGVNVRDQR